MRVFVRRALKGVAWLCLASLVSIPMESSGANASPPPAQICQPYSSNPVLTGGPQGSWDNASVGRTSIILDHGILKMWYTVTKSDSSGSSFQIGYATSTDGVTWRKYPNPVFSGGPTGSWDDKGVEAPSVVWNGTSFVMLFSGSNGTTGTNQI